MDRSIEKDNFWLQLGPLIGPVMIFCLALVIILRTTEASITIPLIAFLGLVCSHIFRWKGVVFASLSLCAILIYHFLHQPSSTWAWTIVLSLSAVSSFFVTVLCSDASAITLRKLFTDLHDNKNTISHLGMRLSDGYKQQLIEKNEMASLIESLKMRFEKAEEESQSLERKIKLTCEELEAAHLHQESLEQILMDTRHQNAVISEAFVALQKTDKLAVQNALSEKGQEQIEVLKTGVRDAQAANQVSQDREIRRLNGLYNQLKIQFTEKSQTLNETRKELFLMQERWDAFQRELEETKLQEDNLIIDLIQKNLKEAELEIDEMEAKYNDLRAIASRE